MCIRLHSSTDCTLEPKCVNCTQSHPSDSKLKSEKEIQIIKTNRNISYVEARKLIAPQLSQTYAQAAKFSTINNSTQTDENTKIECPPLNLLQPLSSLPKSKYINIHSFCFSHYHLQQQAHLFNSSYSVKRASATCSCV
ncbi:uncharacterized protein TNCV_1619621 [Trichonephila clavipes]|nr:uncharacterized protein TNCV_1619621 [Trichonephila clavipes]